MHDTLMRAILEDPADDLCRLAYADWLAENSDPLRAEFIHCQVSLLNPADYPEHTCIRRRRELNAILSPDCPNCCLLTRNLRALELTPLAVSWLPAPLRTTKFSWQSEVNLDAVNVPLLDRKRNWRIDWRRGFIWGVHLPLFDFRHLAWELFSRHPIEVVHLTDRFTEYDPGSAINRVRWLRGESWSDTASKSHVPAELFDLLTGIRRDDSKTYRSAASAIPDLSRACVAWARQRTGLSV